MIRQQAVVQPQQAPKESKGDAFRRLMPARVNKVVQGLKQIGNCSELSRYAYTESEVRQVFEAVRKAEEEAQMRFSHAASRNGTGGFHFE